MTDTSSRTRHPSLLPEPYVWRSVNARDWPATGLYRHIVRKGHHTSLCSTTALPPQVWRPVRGHKPDCPACTTKLATLNPPPKEPDMTTIDHSIPQPLIDAIIAADSGPPTDCPRCGGGIPNDLHRGEYPGALSRWDNNTMICSACGLDEALTGRGHTSLHPTLGAVRWHIFRGRSSSPDTENPTAFAAAQEG